MGSVGVFGVLPLAVLLENASFCCWLDGFGLLLAPETKDLYPYMAQSLAKAMMGPGPSPRSIILP